MAQLTLQQQSLDDTNLIAVVRTLMSLLRLKDDGSGNVDILTNQEALPIAKTFWEAYADELGVIPIDGNITGQEYAQCIFKKLRLVFRDAHLRDAVDTPLKTYRSAVTAANVTARSEIDNILGVD